MSENYSSGSLIILSGPSGCGKSTVSNVVLKDDPKIHFSISCTTRDPRPGEEHGKAYFFITREEFKERIDNDEFLEYAEVHGNYYGTLKEQVAKAVQGGEDIILDIDVQGARQVREEILDTPMEGCTTFIFFAPPSFEELEQRLRGRATDSEEVIARRLANAKGEMKSWKEYDYLLINDEVDKAAKRLRAILDSSHMKTTAVNYSV